MSLAAANHPDGHVHPRSKPSNEDSVFSMRESSNQMIDFPLQLDQIHSAIRSDTFFRHFSTMYQHMKSKALFMDREVMLPDQTRVTMDQRESVRKENQYWWCANYLFPCETKAISRFPQFEMWAWVKLEHHPNPESCILLVQDFQSLGLPNVDLH